MILSKIKPENSDCTEQIKKSTRTQIYKIIIYKTLTSKVGILTNPECKNPTNTGMKKANPNTNKIPATIEKNAIGL